MYYLLTGRKAVRGFEANPFLLRYNSDPRGALGDANQLLAEIRRAHATVIVDGPDALFAERPHLKALYGELEHRGDIVMVESVGRFRFFRPRVDAEPADAPSPAAPTDSSDAARPTRQGAPRRSDAASRAWFRYRVDGVRPAHRASSVMVIWRLSAG